MRPIFTIHAGEFLAGDHINRKLGGKYDVWVPAKDSGVDLLVTRKRHRGRAVSLQVKFSRGFSIPKELAQHVIATSWFVVNPQKLRRSQADLWVFVIITLSHEQHFVVIPKRELRKRIPRSCGKRWDLYLWVYNNRSCCQVRELSKSEKLDTINRGVRDRNHNFSEWLENWKLIDKYSKGSR